MQNISVSNETKHRRPSGIENNIFTFARSRSLGRMPGVGPCRIQECRIVCPHATQDGDFPNVPKHIANPENAAVFRLQ